jgi:curved DNA-binding protein CbpA
MALKYKTDTNHYAVLEVDFGASAEDIKKQYKKLARKYHPDKNRDVDRSIFQEITESFHALSDEEFRSNYDLFWYEHVEYTKTDRQRKEEEQRELREREAREREEEEQRREALERLEEVRRQLREHDARERKEEELREREAKLQQEREKEQCKECECLKRKQVMDEQLSKKVVEDLKKQVETLKSQLVESEKEVDTVMCELFESQNEQVAWKKQFWILNDKYEALQQKNMEMYYEIPDAEIQREAKRQRKPDGPECCRADITAELLKICANDVRRDTDAAGIDWYAVIDFMNLVCTDKDEDQVQRTWKYFRYRSKFRNEIAELTRRQDGTTVANISGLERMLTMLGKKHIGTDFYSLVGDLEENF